MTLALTIERIAQGRQLAAANGSRLVAVQDADLATILGALSRARIALESWPCGLCNQGNLSHRSGHLLSCEACKGTGKHPIALAALAEKREGAAA